MDTPFYPILIPNTSYEIFILFVGGPKNLVVSEIYFNYGL